MGLAAVHIEQIEESARAAALMQIRVLKSLKVDTRRLTIEPLQALGGSFECVSVVSADAGQISVMLAPFQLELLHVADSAGRVLLTTFFPLTTLAGDLESLFAQPGILQNLASRLACEYEDLSQLWYTASPSQPPLPRDVRLTAELLRELAEWGAAAELAAEARESQDLPRLVIRDGTLRSFSLRRSIFQERLPQWWCEVAWAKHRSIVAGISKRSSLWHRLGLSLSQDPRVRQAGCCYVVIPDWLESEVSRRPEGERLGFGRMVLLKTQPDSLSNWLPVDLPEWVVEDSALMQSVLAAIADSSRTTFPVPGYPAAIQAAHEAARLSEFDAKVVRDMIVRELAGLIPASELEQMLRYWAFQVHQWPKTGGLRG